MMVATRQKTQNLVLFYAGDSLVHQIADWVHRYGRGTLHLSGSKSIAAIRAGVGGAGTVVVDATEDLSAALHAVEVIADCVGATNTVVYTEGPHPALTMLMRARRVRLLHGPLSPFEWAQVLQAAERRPAALPYLAQSWAGPVAAPPR